MKTLIAMLVLLKVSTVSAVEGVVCRGVDCKPVEVESSRGRGLINLRGDQKSKLAGPSQDPSNKNYMFREETDQEQGMDLKFDEVKVGTCLIDPTNSTTYYRILEKDNKTTKIRYVAENEEHNYMLRGNFVIWKLPDTSNAFKKLRKYPCKRTPNLWDDSYINSCAKGVKLGDLYCNPKKKF